MKIEDYNNFFNGNLKENGFYLFKNFLKTEVSWEDILEIVSMSSTIPHFEHDRHIKNAAPFEIWKNHVQACKDIFVPKSDSFKPEAPVVISDMTLFFSISLHKSIRDGLLKSVYDSAIDINNLLELDFVSESLKVSIAPKYVPFEIHDYKTAIIQLQGKSLWRLRNEKLNVFSDIALEKGDYLIFPENTWHEITNDSPRSSLVARLEDRRSK